MIQKLKYFSLSLFIFSGCISSKKQPEKIIIYRVFDSLEQHFVNQINDRLPQKPSGFAIDPICSNCYYGLKPDQDHRLYQIGLVYELAPTYDDEIMKKSNRYISIGGKLYPVFIILVDDIFLSISDTFRNKPAIYGPRYPVTHGFLVVTVDMVRKTFK